jgi:mono/diheme cytochrome c family protein
VHRRRKLSAATLGAIFAAGLFLTMAHAGQQASKPDPWDVALAKAPPKAASWPNPYAGRRDALLAGRKLFRRYCAECHGRDARGSMKAPNLHSPVVQQAAPGVLFWFFTNGNLWHGMPSWSGLPDQQRWQLVTYVKSLGERKEAGNPAASAR